MPLTPVEIRHSSCSAPGFAGTGADPSTSSSRRSPTASRRSGASAPTSSDRLEELEAEAAKHRELEALLRSTLVSAERAAQDMKEQARRESDLIVQEAHAEARRVTRESAAEKRRLEEDIVRIRAQLRAAFESLGEMAGRHEEGREDAQTPVTRPPRSARSPTAASARSPAEPHNARAETR